MNSAEIQELKQTLAAINESKTKLELELAKKDDELEGFKQVIYKLQNQLEANKDKDKDFEKIVMGVWGMLSEKENENEEQNEQIEEDKKLRGKN